MISYGASDVEIPGHNSQLLFHRAVHGEKGKMNFIKDWMDKEDIEENDLVRRRVIPNEATVYQKDQIYLVKLHHADHNNGKLKKKSYFEKT